MEELTNQGRQRLQAVDQGYPWQTTHLENSQNLRDQPSSGHIGSENDEVGEDSPLSRQQHPQQVRRGRNPLQRATNA